MGGARVGLINGEFIIDPSVAQLENSSLDLLVVGTRNAIVMVEGEAGELSESTIIDAISFAHKRIIEVVDAIEELGRAVGKEKMKIAAPQEDPALFDEIKKMAAPRFEQIIAGTNSKQGRQALIEQLQDEVSKELCR